MKKSFRNSDEFQLENFVVQTEIYAEKSFDVARQFIDDLSINVPRHHDIHCISFTGSLRSVIGYSLDEFANLLDVLKPQLEAVFPNSEFILMPGQRRKFCSIRMKVFIIMFRLKQGGALRTLEKVFGWPYSSIGEWFKVILKVIKTSFYRLHEGLLKWLGKNWQERECLRWRLKHLLQNDLVSFTTRIKVENKDAESKGHQPIFQTLARAGEAKV